MSCDKYLDQIPSFIKKELDGEKRIRIKNHLKTCVDCRDAYLAQVNIYYIVDREEIIEPVPETLEEFSNEVLARMDQSSVKKGHINTKMIWYAAAATLLIGITIGRFVIPENSSQKYLSQSEDATLSQLIASEDWGRLEVVFSNKTEFKKYSTDSIPIHILLEKLSALQKMGVESLPIANTSDQESTREVNGEQTDPQIQISLNDFIRLLEQAKLQRSRITFEEVANLLTKI